jgi:hypothetical protein
MKKTTDKSYQQFVQSFAPNRRLALLVKYLDRKSLLLKFYKQLNATYQLQGTDDLDSLKLARIPLINQRFHLQDDAIITGLTELLTDFYPFDASVVPNYEQILVQEEDISQTEREKYFCYHDNYALIAVVYSEPFKDSLIYESVIQVYYYLVMYLNLELSFNKYELSVDYHAFNVKLATQTRLINELSDVDEQYNTLIRTMNRWLTSPIIYRILKEESKAQQAQKKLKAKKK